MRIASDHSWVPIEYGPNTLVIRCQEGSKGCAGTGNERVKFESLGLDAAAEMGFYDILEVRKSL